jgi:hypothetical protein
MLLVRMSACEMLGGVEWSPAATPVSALVVGSSSAQLKKSPRPPARAPGPPGRAILARPSHRPEPPGPAEPAHPPGCLGSRAMSTSAARLSGFQGERRQLLAPAESRALQRPRCLYSRQYMLEYMHHHSSGAPWWTTQRILRRPHVARHHV